MATYTSNYAWTKPEGGDPVDITVLNNNLDSQDNIVHNAYMQFAPVFSTASTYAVDDVVLYANNLYKCITAVTVAGAWDSTKWTQVKVSDICGGGGGGGGTTNYNQLTNKPQINSVELSGNKTSAQLGLMASDGVVANPTGQTTSTLTALEVGGTKYAVGGGGTSDYADLTNKPQINGVTLTGNKSTSDLGIDAAGVGLGNVPNVTTDDQTPTFTTAQSRNNLVSGEKLSVIMGKIAKFFNDLKTVAFTGSFSDLSNKPENANTFQGTIAEWNQLTTAEKKAYDHASIPDSLDGNVTFPASKVMLNSGDSVEEKIGNMRMTKLWENQNPSASFAGQDVNISIAGYDFVMIFALWNNEYTQAQAFFGRVGAESILLYFSLAGATNGSYIMHRAANISVLSKITFADAKEARGTAAASINNNTCVPTAIYGIKLT